jgi:exonuclease III
MASNEPLGFLSLNTNGLGETNKRLSLIGWLDKFHNASSKIILLQETHSTDRTKALWEKQWHNREIICSHGDSGSRGVAIVLPKNVDYTVNSIIRSNNGRYVSINITFGKNTFCLINGYAPNTNKPKDQLKWLSEIQKILIDNNEENVIVGGDLNDVFIPMLDRFRCKPNTMETEYVKAWKTICEELNLSDFWRIVNPTTQQYTWRQGSSLARLKQSRLDYWLVSIHMIYDLDTIEIKTSTRSDHSLIELNFYKSRIPQRGPSFWNFNASLL